MDTKKTISTILWVLVFGCWAVLFMLQEQKSNRAVNPGNPSGILPTKPEPQVPPSAVKPPKPAIPIRK
ncbi:MAG: hypothetical protein H6577_13740 [Lewinellaceae bacterium]|nr:hypothetical protein [Saprospiraceae bacterium]MCB9339188.1 hypothetical protein [Lewinellaceae bacterium]